ncbi:DUF4177 domain-containing protein [Neobacillus sp. PS3-40]|uniref:DUF4177 domain-containing protein n=1 Tax=Neobacillus sp. PS3-40 TaxID=3070679 RepID=UPI0027DFCBFB|nr:DUF4177 domain-containing protein [Neobacillus sp. PS3-40]WML46161.1 DUF4177 domain-containing protein [Neobacillus sp. PS3-40]
MKVEYKKIEVRVKDENFEKKLNELGDEDWEVISTSPINVAGSTGSILIILSRKI